MEWSTFSETNSNAWSGWNWSFWKETSDNYWDETQAMRIGDCGEAPPLFLESVLATFFLQKSGLEATERENPDSGGNGEQI